MTKTLLITIVVFLIAVAAMAVGVIVSNRRLKGSCGGLANMKDSQGRTICDACTDPAPDCTGDPATDQTTTDQTATKETAES